MSSILDSLADADARARAWKDKADKLEETNKALIDRLLDKESQLAAARDEIKRLRQEAK